MYLCVFDTEWSESDAILLPILVQKIKRRRASFKWVVLES